MAELIIVIGVLGLLATIALPAYFNYIRRGYFSDLQQTAVTPYQEAVNHCYQVRRALARCNAGVHAIPAAITTSHGMVEHLTVKRGVITVNPVPYAGIKTSDSYTLVPTPSKGSLRWSRQGRAVAKGYIDE